jgi:hypothetical protein
MTTSVIVPGMRFGRLTVIRKARSGRQGQHWECQCDCGNITQPLAGGLRRGTTKSCGCLAHSRIINIIGKRFGRLTVIGRAGSNSRGQARWECQCDCGNITQTQGSSLRQGLTQSCGCLFRKQLAARNYRHGGTASPLYNCWKAMKNRCLDSNAAGFKNYGGRGITIAPEWIDDFVAFRDYVNQNIGPRPKGCTLDRIENNEGYFPGNIKWSTKSQQAHNSRQSRINKVADAVLLEYAKPKARWPRT